MRLCSGCFFQLIIMDTQPVLIDRYKKSLKFLYAYFADLILFIGVVEGLRFWMGPFEGFVKTSDIALFRYGFFALGLAQIFIIKKAANHPLKSEEVGEPKDAFSQLQASSIIVFALCDLVALLGLLLFLFFGLHRDFYVFSGLSIFYLFVYFPKYREWEQYLRSTGQLR